MAKLRATWGEVTVECFQLAPDADSNVFVSLAIAHQPLDPQILTSHLHLTVHPNAIDSNIAIQSIALPFLHAQTISDPSILHLLQLLRTEMQVPQLMNQMFVDSIVNILIAHIIQHQQD
jgi:hypothetical protein